MHLWPVFEHPALSALCFHSTHYSALRARSTASFRGLDARVVPASCGPAGSSGVKIDLSEAHPTQAQATTPAPIASKTRAANEVPPPPPPARSRIDATSAWPRARAISRGVAPPGPWLADAPAASSTLTTSALPASAAWWSGVAPAPSIAPTAAPACRQVPREFREGSEKVPTACRGRLEAGQSRAGVPGGGGMVEGRRSAW